MELLDRIRAAAHDGDTAHQALVALILAARANGHSLRTIAAAAGMSHERVRRIEADAQEPVA